ncbi:hypothetical protein Pcinc_036953 [Petrolisthes cinctipes]|uniref:Ig-like domain-containing protein n=1 Tax=Petrolisthes cinctipes TaxID=88211 RepID=A0AAE1BTS1_PETCI|nr:hypothetical protein Pcinc_036953 [Petrolisthes cinctipes]
MGQGVGRGRQGVGRMGQGVGRGRQGVGRGRQGVEKVGQGVERVKQGVRRGRVRQGVERERQGVERVRQGVGRGRQGVGRMRQGVGRMRQGVGRMRQGVGRERQGVGNERQGVGKERQGIETEIQSVVVWGLCSARYSTVLPGQDAVLRCELYTTTPVQVIWYKDTAPLTQGEYRLDVDIPGGGAGRYTRHFTVSFADEDSSSVVSRRRSCGLGGQLMAFIPRISLWAHRAQGVKGSSVVLPCRLAHHSSLTALTWSTPHYTNITTPHTHHKYQVLETGDLVINNLKKGDGGVRLGLGGDKGEGGGVLEGVK